jgi:hypothetical protein
MRAGMRLRVFKISSSATRAVSPTISIHFFNSYFAKTGEIFTLSRFRVICSDSEKCIVPGIEDYHENPGRKKSYASPGHERRPIHYDNHRRVGAKNR